MTDQLITPEQVAEIEARAGAGMTSDILALCRTLRVARAESEWQKSSIESLSSGVSGCSKRLAAALHENAALREQLAQTQSRLAEYERLERAVNAISERVLIPEVLAAMDRLKESK